MAANVKRLWLLAAMIAVLPGMMAFLAITGDTQLLIEMFPMLAGCTVVGIIAIVALYREGRDPTKKS